MEEQKATLLNTCSDLVLIDELLNRYDHCIFSGIKVLNERRGDSTNIRRFHGNHVVCAGMCTSLGHVITHAFEANLQFPIGNYDELQ